jgi:hypothetical protein
MTDEANKRSEELHEPRMEWQAERYSIATLLIVSWALALVVAPHDAIARVGKCTLGSQTPAEESLLLATARRILPKHADLVVSNLCGSTSAEITTQKIADRGGASMLDGDGSLSC